MPPARARAVSQGLVIPQRLIPKTTIEPGRVRDVPGEWIHADGASTSRIVMYVHGGGYVVCSPGTHRIVTTSLSRSARARVFAVDYRKAPETAYPGPLDDVERAYLGLLASGVDPNRIAVAGDSAGGALSVALMVRLGDKGIPLPAALALLSPWVDHTARGGSIDSNAPFDYLSQPGLDWFSGHYRGNTDPADPGVSPVFARLSGLPPTLIQAGGAEILLDQVRDRAARVSAAGVDVHLREFPGMIHVWHMFATAMYPGRVALRDIGRFIRQQIPD